MAFSGPYMSNQQRHFAGSRRLRPYRIRRKATGEAVLCGSRSRYSFHFGQQQHSVGPRERSIKVAFKL